MLRNAVVPGKAANEARDCGSEDESEDAAGAGAVGGGGYEVKGPLQPHCEEDEPGVAGGGAPCRGAFPEQDSLRRKDVRSYHWHCYFAIHSQWTPDYLD